MFYLITGAAAIVAAIVLCFIPRGYSALLAFLGMVIFRAGGYAAVSSEQLWFWGAASLIVLAIGILLPVTVATSRRGVGYVTVATATGLFVGVLISPNAMVASGAVGAVCGAMAYSFTPAGKVLDFPSRNFVQYLCAKALPPLITLSVIAITVVLTAAGIKPF